MQNYMPASSEETHSLRVGSIRWGAWGQLQGSLLLSMLSREGGSLSLDIYTLQTQSYQNPR